MIKAVLFDVDGVLLDSFEANLKFFQDLITQAGYTPPTREEYRELFHLPLVDVLKVHLRLDSPAEIERIANMRRNSVRYPIELLSMPHNAIQTIVALHKGYTLGIVTSRIRGGVFESPELATLKECFSTVICYEDTKEHKPHPEPLLLALENVGAQPEEAVYIGDSYYDMEASRTAGMKFIYYSDSDLAGTDAVTTIFKDLPKIVKSLD